MNEALVTELLEAPDNVEKIRDQIAGILKLETVRQYQKAQELNLENARDYLIGVYLEKDRPWQLTENSDGANPFPLVNVQLMGYKKDNDPGSTVKRQKYIAEYVIDCYARGQMDNPDGDDTDATKKAWALGRKIRNILMAGFYSYLGMRDIVRRREVIEALTSTPTEVTGNIDDSAISVTICRILFCVHTFEDSPQIHPGDFEGITFTATTPDGEVRLIDN
jgi:hypothetical protein